METRYNVYFAGQLLPGQELTSVRDKLAKLFNADQQTLEKLFSGKAQLLKRDCDKATALKYKQAMERAGAQPVIKATTSAPFTQSIASSPYFILSPKTSLQLPIAFGSNTSTLYPASIRSFISIIDCDSSMI